MQRLFFLERHNFRVVPRKDNQNLLERPARWSLKCCVMLVAIVQVKVGGTTNQVVLGFN